jgi:tetratricopeptide (TPR) repeat protein
LLDRVLAALATDLAVVVLDNFETPWTADPLAIEELLRTIGKVPQVAVAVSARGTDRPSGLRWRDFSPLHPLALFDARRLFMAVTERQSAVSRQLDELLAELDGVPLAIELMGYAIRSEGSPDEVAGRWRAERNGILQRMGGGSRELSVAVSVEASVTSPLMIPAARRLFSLLGMLPDGVSRDDLTALLTDSGPAAAAVLRQLGLAFDEGERLRVLAPIREQAAAANPPQPPDLARAVTHYCELAAALGDQVDRGEAAEASPRLQAEVGNITAMLERAAADHRIDELVRAASGLANYWRIAGLAQPAVLGMAEQAIEKDGTPAQRALIENALAGLAFNQSDYDNARARYEQALPLYQRAGNVLGAADSIQRLGDIALVRSDYDTARHQYQRALSLYQEAGDLHGEANTTKRVGDIAYDRGRLDEADDWYRKALTIFEGLGNRPRTASTYHQLGNTAYLRRRLDEADDWYRKSLTIEQELGDRSHMAATYHQLGMTAQGRGRLDEADDWYRSSLAVKEDLGNRSGMSVTYHQLGITAQGRGRLDEADDWYRKALTIEEEFGDRPGMAMTYGQLGLLAEAREQPGQALAWIVRCVSLFDQFPHPVTEPGPRHLARLSRQLGIPALEQAWQQVTGQPVPQAVRDYIISYQDEDAPGGKP